MATYVRNEAKNEARPASSYDNRCQNLRGALNGIRHQRALKLRREVPRGPRRWTYYALHKSGEATADYDADPECQGDGANR